MQMIEASSDKVDRNLPLEHDRKILRVDEICSLAQIRPYVLRFWEGQFDEIAPIMSENGQKFYSQSDLNAITLIKELLFDRKLTVELAKIEIKNLIISLNSQKAQKLAETLMLEGEASPESAQVAVIQDDVEVAIKVKVSAEQILALKAHALDILSTIDNAFERHFQ